MLHTLNGWQEIAHEDGMHRTYMAIFTPVDEDNWEGIVALVPSIDNVVRQHALQSAAHISLSAGVLTVTFDVTDGRPIPQSFHEAGKELLPIITGKN